MTAAAPEPDPLANALAILAGTPEALRALAPAAGASRDAGGWGLQHIVAHLLDVNRFVFIARIRRMVEEDNPSIPPIDPGGRIEAGGYLARELESVLDQFAETRATDIAWVRSLSPADLARTGTHTEAGVISAGEIAHFWAYHDLTHLKQAAAILQSGLIPHIGAQTQFIEEV